MTRTTAANDADFNVTGLGQASLPRRPRESSTAAPRVPLPTQAAPPLQNPIKHYGRDAKTFVISNYTFDEGPANKPGTAAYYKSHAFRKRKADALARAGNQSTASHGDDNKSDGDHQTNHQKGDKKSLIMVFSRNAVRRSTLTGSVANRAKRASKRQKFMRKVNNVETFFEWD